jgi:hypothetical protein
MIEHNRRLSARGAPREMLANGTPVAPPYSPAFVCQTPLGALGRLTELALDPSFGGPLFGVRNELPELPARGLAPGNGGAGQVSS